MESTIRPSRDATTRWMIILFMLVTMVGAAPATPSFATQQPGGSAPLELPAMTLTLGDLTGAGMPNYGMLESQSTGTGSLPRAAGDWTDEMGNDGIQETLVEMGLLEGYEFSFRLRQDPVDVESDVARDLQGSLHEFTGDSGPANALAFFNGLGSSDEQVQQIEGSGAIPGAVLVRIVYGEGDDLSYSLSIAFQAGSVLAVMEILDYLGQEPTVQEAETLATLLGQRIEEALQNGTLGLGNKAPRLKDAEFDSLYEVRRDQYLRRDGVDIPLWFEESDQIALRAERAGSSTDYFELLQFVQEDEIADSSLPVQFGWGTRIYRFQDDAAATAWLSDRPDQIEAEFAGSDETVEGLQVIQDSPTFGDESITVTYLAANGFTSQVSRVFVRVANTVADIRLTASAPNDMLAAIQALATIQAECLTNSCPDPMTLSDALTGQVVGSDPVVETPAPDPAGTATTEMRGVLDLAAITLKPGDLEMLGLLDYGMDFGVTIYPDEIIATAAAARSLSDAEVRQAIEGTGLEQRYENYLYLPVDAADPGGLAGRLVVSYVVEFADEAGAAAAWEFMEDESYSPSAQDVPLAAVIGEQSEATRDQGQDPQTGETFEQLDVTFQAGNLHAGVAIVDWQGQEPQVTESEALTKRLLERIEMTRNASGPGLYGQVVRLTGDVVAPSADYYLLLDSEAVRFYGDSQSQTILNDFVSSVEGEVDAYRVHQQVAAGTEAPEDDVWFLLDATRFADEETAVAWLAGAQQRIGSNAAFANLTFVQTQTFGDESISYTLSTADGAIAYRGVSLRVGAVVVTIDVTAPQTPLAAAVESLAQVQAACLIAGGCAEPLAVPADLT